MKMHLAGSEALLPKAKFALINLLAHLMKSQRAFVND